MSLKLLPASAAVAPSSLLPLIRKLESIYPLRDGEKEAVINLPMHVRELEAGQDIVREGDRPSQCCLLLDGFAQRYKVVGDGCRQIMSFHVPGDMPDVLSLHLPVMDHSLGTLAASKVGFISHQSVRRLIQDHPRIGDAFWRDTLVDAAVFREWLVGMGRRDAHARIAHLFCEIVTRLDVVGLAPGRSVQIPITQSTIADALGLSAAHVNRVVQELRSEGLITWRGRILTVNDWDGLKQAGDFDAAYLHLAPESEGVASV
jgi:CRP-like cAMP-binding protein